MAERLDVLATKASTNSVPVLDSRKLFNGCKTIAIEHNGQQYSLRITASGKLILTK